MADNSTDVPVNMANNSTDVPVDELSVILKYSLECYDSQAYRICLLCVMCICVIPAIFGNTLIVISYVKLSSFHGKAMYKYIVNMAISDLLLGLFMFLYPADILISELRRYKYFCILRFVFLLFGISSSAMFLTLISIDRFLSVVYPLDHMVKTQNKRITWMIIGVTWMMSVILSLAQIFNNYLDSYSNYDENIPCINSAVFSKTFQFICEIFIASALVIDFILYVFIVRAIVYSPMTKTRPKDAIAKTKLMILVYVTFLICWSPMLVVSFIFKENKSSATRFTVCIGEYLFLLGVLQSCTNWIYYGVWNVQFRKAFKTICCSRGEDRNSARST